MKNVLLLKPTIIWYWPTRISWLHVFNMHFASLKKCHICISCFNMDFASLEKCQVCIMLQAFLFEKCTRARSIGIGSFSQPKISSPRNVFGSDFLLQCDWLLTDTYWSIDQSITGFIGPTVYHESVSQKFHTNKDFIVYNNTRHSDHLRKTAFVAETPLRVLQRYYDLILRLGSSTISHSVNNAIACTMDRLMCHNNRLRWSFPDVSYKSVH